ncbi:MAG: hypothetical protein MJB14_09870, partial [Spirochaetes bacterium]|nr:hypothetical protein [Spirochaetota bacterium]
MTKKIFRILFIILIAVLVFLYYRFDLNRYFNYENILQVREFIIGFGILGPIIILIIFAILNLMVLPTAFFI